MTPRIRTEAEKYLGEHEEIGDYDLSIIRAFEAGARWALSEAAKKAEQVAQAWDDEEGPSYCASADEAAIKIRQLADEPPESA